MTPDDQLSKYSTVFNALFFELNAQLKLVDIYNPGHLKVPGVPEQANRQPLALPSKAMTVLQAVVNQAKHSPTVSQGVLWLSEAGPYQLRVHHHQSSFRCQLSPVITTKDTDGLTGLASREALQPFIEQLISQAPEQPFGLMYIDLDQFKRINDAIGHHVGDELLVLVGQRLGQYCRSQDLLAHTGGDEFMLVCPGVSDCRALADELLSQFRQPFQVSDNHLLTVSLSIGVAVYPSDGSDFIALYRAADIAMHHAKRMGKNGVASFSPRMRTRADRQYLLEQGLRNAVYDNEFALLYQPQINVRSHQLEGIEALIRWYHPSIGEVPPVEFIPLAEDIGMLDSLGDWVVKRAIKDLGKLRQQGLTDVHVAINLGAGQLRPNALIHKLYEYSEQYKVPKHCIEVELTEGAAILDIDATQLLFSELRGAGFQIAIDDFGTGYSSLAYLADLQVNRLKIDKRFIDGLANSESDANIILVIASLADLLGFELIAEGVETRDQVQTLLRLGCVNMQGYYFARPMHAHRLIEWQAGFTHQRPAPDSQLSAD